VGGHKERVNKGEYGGCILYSYYENRRMKPAEIVLIRDGGEGTMMEGANLTKIYCKHIGKYSNISPCTNVIC
jgi:hypothetical protein